jgi:putative glutathione S-transferase
MLVNGIWSADWQPIQAKDDQGRFVRQNSKFRNWITADGTPGPTGDGGFMAERDRYRLYVALICPWASRTLMVRKLKRLEDIVPVTVVEPFLSDQGWRFGDYPGADRDPLHGFSYLHELYTAADPTYTGRATVPVLWDTRRNTIVSNESADIVRMLNTAFDAHGDASLDLYPAELRAGIDELNERIYDRLNNGVYKAGFASTQPAYEEAVTRVFDMLDELELRLSDGRRYLFGDRLTESDVRLFVTLVRFDPAYHGLFKCNLRRIVDYPKLNGYVKRIYGLPGIADTVNLDHIKAGYYSIKALNPSGIVPIGPAAAFAAP